MLDQPSSTPSKEPQIFSLAGRRAVVTGGGGHLGSILCQGLAAAGAAVHLLGRNAEKLAATVQKIESQGHKASLDVLDLRNMDEIGQFAARFTEREGSLDILVNNAYGGPTNTLEKATVEQYRDAFEIAVVSAAELVKSLLPAMKSAAAARGDASVINIASMYGHVSPDPSIYGESGMNSPPYYGAAKGALIQYTRYAACHLAPHGIRVNAVSPGPFPPIGFRESKPDFYQQLINKVPMQRIGLPEDLIGPVVFLASQNARYVTGINLPVDGGWTAW
jgi:NAD(P)-dependent dehydrogenase (short-subunit alcohol dehydrogenase family)